MNYQVRHSTTYDYHEMVAVCQNVVHLAPRPVRWQLSHRHRLVVRPVPATMRRQTDYFGNPVTHFAIHEGHRKLSITSISQVEVRSRPVLVPSESLAWEAVRDAMPADRTSLGLDTYQFCFDSPRIGRAANLAAYAAVSFLPRRPILEAALDLNRRIHADFAFDPHATNVFTPLAEVFEKRRGVCQDLAHVGVGCLRSIGLAARYVSGYLRTVPPPGKPRLVGADVSHAWISLCCGALGWVDLDPTNDVLVDTDHITIGWGRDYNDVCPINGMFIGGGQHAMHVSVDVEPIDENGVE
jgi:transglutaminase-like putative cysteine protease